ncbi:MAG: lysophospholipid acyltransferase family protein [Pseudomonadales bacterium]|nr:lysophospholipid acyltransferase family protein [Pseudomonadales bacterium]
MEKNQIKVSLLISLMKLTARFSLPTVQRLGGGFGWLAAQLPAEITHVTQKNIDMCFPELSPQSRRKLVVQTMMHTGYLMMEIGSAWFRTVEDNLRLISQVRGQSIMDDAAAQGRGVIVIAPHLGNWEWLNSYTSQRYPGVMIYSPSKQPQFDSILRKSREIGGGKLAPANAAGVKTVFKHLKQGGVVYILPDQVPGKEGGIVAPFFGIPAFSMTLVSRLANKTNARVVAVYGKRLPKHQGFETVYINADERIYSKDVQTSVTGLNATVEACIRDAPEQYQWSYKRFKRSAELGLNIYASK